jgi:oligopeptide/dipeptide ABC transporter ATP-binding protein
MYAGKEVEQADVIALFRQPHHPYTRGLIESLPEQGSGDQRLRTISGQPPSMVKIPSGCSFHPRCKYVMDICKIQEPPLEGFAAAAGHFSACWLPHELAGSDAGWRPELVTARSADEPEEHRPPAATGPS